MRPLALPNLDRLTVRLAVGVAVLVIVPLGAVLYLLSQYHFDQTIAARRSAAELENRMLEAALRHQMITKDSRLMNDILTEIGQQPEVRRAMILDHEGVIRLSSEEQSVGVRVSLDSPTCRVCHAQTPETRQRWVLIEEEGTRAELLRTVRPIVNRQECHGCHDPANELNGILILDVPLAPIEDQLRRDATLMLLATVILTLVLLVGVGLLVRRLILRRLARLSHTARLIAAGATRERAEVEGDDVIAELATDFNEMAGATSALIGELKDREQQIAGVLNSLDDGLVVLDKQFRVVAANRSLSRRVCSYPESLRGRNCRDAIGHALPCEDDHDCPTARCLRTGTVQRAVFRAAGGGAEGGDVHEVYASPVFAADGSVAQVVEVWRDITERVREEERLAEIERLSSLGVLASGLSHEVNTPLASTLMCAESILGRLDGDAESGATPETVGAVREDARIIRQQVLRCRKITERFLRFARGIPPTIEPIDLREVVRSILALAEPTARSAGIELTFPDSDPLPMVTANTEVVQHVVLNVLVNAIESIDGSGGKIDATFVVVSEDVRLRIRDNGCGISDEVQRRMFEPFRSEKSRGTGLGLFLARRFMRRFGGDVRLVESVVGQGTCIEIIFPRTDGPP